MTMVLIESQVISGDATIDFVTGIDDTYETYEFVLSGVVPANDGVDLYLAYSDDAGVSWEAGASDYSYATGSNTSVPAEANNGNTTLATGVLTPSVIIGSAAGEHISGTIRMHGPANTDVNTLWETRLVMMETTANRVRSLHGVLSANVTTAVDGVQFLFSAGNLESGRITLFGIKHT